jgi:hypothetical protein
MQSRRVIAWTAYVIILKLSHWLVSSKRSKKVHLGHASRVPSTKCAFFVAFQVADLKASSWILSLLVVVVIVVCRLV